MRFYWFDGKAPQGPWEIADLLAQPGFNSESVVCPVGAERPEDWKAAVSYEPLRDALFKPKPALISSPPPVQPPCPVCHHQNTDDALFCSHCGRNLSEVPDFPRLPPLALAPAPKLSSLPIGPAVPPLSAPSQSHADSDAPAVGAALPPGPALPKPPEVSAGPKRGPVPGTMGRLGQIPVQPKVPPSVAKPPAAPPVAGPASRPAAAPAAKNRPLLLAACAFCGAFVVLAGVFFWRRPSHDKAPAPPVNLAPPAAAKLGTQEGSPTAVPPAEPAAAPVPAKKPAAKPRPAAPAVVKPAVPQPARRRARASRTPAPAAAAQTESLKPPAGPAEPSDAELGRLLQPSAQADPKELLLPGIPKKVRKVADGQGPAPLPASPAAGAAPASQDQLLAERAKEQFNFCHQLLRQGDFGDFYDTCLCAGARNAAPYKGRRRVFIEKSSQDPASEIGSAAEIVDTRVEGEAASITARWSKAEGAAERTEKWAIEDGLWCLKK